MTTSKQPKKRGMLAGGDRVGAEARADGALLDHGQLGRQSAGPEGHGKVACLGHGEVAADLARAAEDRLADDRRRNHLAVKDDGEGQAHVLLRRPGEALGAGRVEAEGHDRLVGALIEAGLGVDQVLAAHQNLLLDHIRLRRVVLRVKQLVVDGHLLAFHHLLHIGASVDHPEFELAGLADQPLQALHVADARNLHEHAVAALALDARLGRAEGVDAAADGLDRRLNGRVHALGEPGIGGLERDAAVAAAAHLEGLGAGQSKRVAHRHGQLAQVLVSLFEVRRLADLHRHGARGKVLREIGVGGAILAQRLAHVVAQLVEPILDHLVLVELIEEMGAALQIEAETDLLVRKPARHGFHGCAREDIGKGKDQAGENDAEHHNQLPLGKMQHCRLSTPDYSLRGLKRLDPSET